MLIPLWRCLLLFQCILILDELSHLSPPPRGHAGSFSNRDVCDKGERLLSGRTGDMALKESRGLQDALKIAMDGQDYDSETSIDGFSRGSRVDDASTPLTAKEDVALSPARSPLNLQHLVVGPTVQDDSRDKALRGGGGVQAHGQDTLWEDEPSLPQVFSASTS